MTFKEEERNIAERYKYMKPFLYNEQLRRTFAASEAKIIGYGGVSLLNRITGIDRETIAKGLKEIENADKVDPSRVRKKGVEEKRLKKLKRDRKSVV